MKKEMEDVDGEADCILKERKDIHLQNQNGI